MENLVLIGQFLALLGVFFIGVACLWWVGVYEKKVNK